MEKQKVYVVTVHGGQYDDKYDYIEGIFTSKEKAVAFANEIKEQHTIDESKLPMTFDTYYALNYGYPDLPENLTNEEYENNQDYYNTVIDRNGYTVADFQKMEEAEMKKSDDFGYCSVKSFVLDEK